MLRGLLVGLAGSLVAMLAALLFISWKDGQNGLYIEAYENGLVTARVDHYWEHGHGATFTARCAGRAVIRYPEETAYHAPDCNLAAKSVGSYVHFMSASDNSKGRIMTTNAANSAFLLRLDTKEQTVIESYR